jgi:FlaG/FlaF family flagellin (archaellin)
MTRFLLRMAVILAAFLSVQLMESQEAAPSPTKATTTESESSVITNEALPKGARIYVAPIQNGFETYIVAGLEKKKVPVVVVADRTKADYELTGISDTDRAGWAKMLFLGSQQTNESASIKIVNLKTGNVVFAYSVNKTNSVRGKQSAGEAVAKHINEKIENRYH